MRIKISNRFQIVAAATLKCHYKSFKETNPLKQSVHYSWRSLWSDWVIRGPRGWNQQQVRNKVRALSFVFCYSRAIWSSINQPRSGSARRGPQGFIIKLKAAFLTHSAILQVPASDAPFGLLENWAAWLIPETFPCKGGVFIGAVSLFLLSLLTFSTTIGLWNLPLTYTTKILVKVKFKELKKTPGFNFTAISRQTFQ